MKQLQSRRVLSFIQRWMPTIGADIKPNSSVNASVIFHGSVIVTKVLSASLVTTCRERNSKVQTIDKGLRFKPEKGTSGWIVLWMPAILKASAVSRIRLCRPSLHSCILYPDVVLSQLSHTLPRCSLIPFWFLTTECISTICTIAVQAMTLLGCLLGLSHLGPLRSE